MSKVTFVVDFEDGKEPAVHAGMTIFGGSLVAVSWRDALEVAENYEQAAKEYAELMTYMDGDGDFYEFQAMKTREIWGNEQ